MASALTILGRLTAAVSEFVRWLDVLEILNPPDGKVVIGDGQAAPMVCLGGVTSASPALKASGNDLALRRADDSASAVLRCRNTRMDAAAAAVGASEIGVGGTTATTVGAAGAAAALPANPVGYWIINVGGTQMKVPYYNT